ncbi:hypothetical protein GGX14DRAFT_597673 [Mycena pura]|uniref:BTB domain-containing protein n=1 Tax=Mycena pura TaxID=153505 RepID=A0AAD6VR92_9AGAR|nr:hypothetical protein GGX14DRAFT_597673 [Mycena pura]
MTTIKKPCTSENTIRDSEFYFEDGNIVLSAKEDGTTVYFRLHRSILTKHSPVFADMFAMPSPPTADCYDDAPLVEMHDEADVLGLFIGLLYDPQCISPILESEDFPALIYEAVVLAKKYQVDWICTMAASRLRQQWPSTLLEWDKVVDAEMADYNAGIDPEYDQYNASSMAKIRRLPEPVAAIRLARECNAPEILPVAFLHLFRLSLEDNSSDLEVWQRPRRELLMPSDLNCLVLARERIGKWIEHILTSMDRNCEGETRMQCDFQHQSLRCRIAIGVASHGNLLSVTRYMKAPSAMCSSCSIKFSDDVDLLRQRFFNRLAHFFSCDVH